MECLQYHLKAAYGYKTPGGPLPSYAHLGCDPKKDPGCQPQLAQKVASGVYLKYPNCDPRKDPACAYAAALAVITFRLLFWVITILFVVIIRMSHCLFKYRIVSCRLQAQKGIVLQQGDN